MTALAAAIDTGPDRSIDRLIHDARRALADGRPAAALGFLHDALELTPDVPLLHHLAGRAHARLNQPVPALAAFRQAAERGGASADLFNDMGNSLRWLGKAEPAANAYRLAIKLQPKMPGLYMNLGNALAAAGDFDGAIQTYAECERNCPNDPVARHMLAALAGRETPDRAADGYVAATFDGFAATFDATLVGKLGYRGPELVGAAMERRFGTPEGRLDILDAGCGTGLCAPVLRPFARRLDGVDLSAEMLARAGARGSYDRLDRTELAAHLAAHPAAWDAIVAADVFSYFGGLAEPFHAARVALRPGGILVATVESTADTPQGFVLHGTGRYAHTDDFVTAQARAAGFEVADRQTSTLRHERGVPVPALVFTLAPGDMGHTEEQAQ